MFFTEGRVFKNKAWGGFVYEPKARIHSRTFYITDLDGPRLEKEYEYEITSNSFGLVQLADIAASRPSILLLGNSYTEGQGASPWFYQLEGRWPKNSFQLINGGILGTGFEAWSRLFDDLAAATVVKKIVIIFISSDWTRPVWQFSSEALACLQSVQQCSDTDYYYGLPEDDRAAQEINRIARQRVAFIRNKTSIFSFRASAIYQKLLRPAYHRWSPYRSGEELQFEKSQAAILKMARDVGHQNILLVQLPQKNELGSGTDAFGTRGKEFIRANGFHFVDGFTACGMEKTDFHLHDGHPNAQGYNKIDQCVERSITATFRLSEN